MIHCCDFTALPTAGTPVVPHAPKMGDTVLRPNPKLLPANEWTKFRIAHPCVVIPVTTPTAVLRYYPGPPPSDTGVASHAYSGAPIDAGGQVMLHAPGEWSIFNPGTALSVIVFDAYNVAAALFHGGVKISGGGGITVTTGAPGTFTPTHVAPIDVDSGADEEVLAAGDYDHLYFRNGSTGTQRLTITGAGITAVASQGWNIGADPTGAKNGEILIFHNPDKMPVGPFRAIASADNALLEITHGT